MYQVFCDKMLIYDSRDDGTQLKNLELSLEMGAPGSFSFTVEKTDIYADLPKVMKSEIEVYEDGEWLWEGRVISKKVGFYGDITYECEGCLAYLNDSIQRQVKYQGATVRGYLTALIDIHNAQVDEYKRFSVGLVTVTDPNDSLYRYTNYNSTAEELKADLLDDLGGYLRVRRVDGVRYLDYVAAEDYGVASEQVIQYGENLADIDQLIDMTEIATAVIPLGAKLDEFEAGNLEKRLTITAVNDGKDYVYNAAAVAAYGWIFKTVTWDTVTVAENLLKKANKYLSDTQWDALSLKVSAVDLHFSDAELKAFRCGDRIRVYSKPHGLDKWFALDELKLYLDNPAKTKIKLGAKTNSGKFTAKTSELSEEAKKTAELVPSVPAVVQQATDNLTRLITSDMGGHVTTKYNADGKAEEILITDAEDYLQATHVWRWNVAGLGYSKTGYNGPYTTGIDMTGHILANKVIAGTACIGDWNIDSKAIYKDVDGGDGYRYRVYLQPPIANTRTWVLSCQRAAIAEDGSVGGFYGQFILYSDGSADFGAGKTKINTDGSITVKKADGSYVDISPAGGLTLYNKSVQAQGRFDTDGSLEASSIAVGGGFAVRSIRVGEVSLNSNAPISKEFLPAMGDDVNNVYVVITARESPADGIIAPKVTATSRTGFTAVLGGTYGGNTTWVKCSYIAFGMG